MIGVIDYGAGNLLSVTNALDALDVSWIHVADARELAPLGIGAVAALLLAPYAKLDALVASPRRS